MLTFTCQDPRNRERDILKAVVENKYNTTPHVNEFGIEVSETLAPVNARLLACPKRFLNGGRLNNWTYVNFASSDISAVAAMTFLSITFWSLYNIGDGMQFESHIEDS